MKYRVVVTCLALSVPFASPLVWSEESSDVLDSVVVTATRIPTPLSEIASSLTVVSADDIAARQIQTVPDLLKQLPGLNVVQSGGPGGQTSVFLRGTNSNHTKVLIDGIDVGDPSNANGAFDFAHLLTQDIQTIEILRGPQSGLYGSDAIGGVINVITKTGNGPGQFNAAVEAGSFNTFNQTAGLSGAADQFHYAASIEHLHAGSTPVTPSDYLPPGQLRIDDFYDNLTGSTKLGFDVTDSLDVGLVARYTDAHLRFTGDNFDLYPTVVPDTAQNTSHTEQYYSRLTAHLRSFDGALQQTFGAAYSNLKSYDLSPDGPVETDNFGARVKFDWQGVMRLAAGQQLLLGAEHQRDSITTPISASTSINSGYGELQSNFGDSLYDTIAVRYDDNDRFGSKVTYRIAPTYLVKETGTKLKGSVGTGFKAPTLSEMFQSFPRYFFANPNLHPETSVGWDAGFEQSSMSDQLMFGITYFHNRIKNLIDSNADETSYANIGRAVTKGVEGFAAYRPSSVLAIRLDYTYTQATDELAQTELLRRPKNKESLNIAWQATQRLTLDTTLLSVSSWVDIDREGSVTPVRAPGYTTVDIAGSFELDSHWALTTRFTNLFNRHYQNPDGFDQPTIGAFAGFKAKF